MQAVARCAPHPHPNPLPTGEGLERARCCFSHRDLPSLLPPGEGAPKGRMRVRAPLRTTKASAALHRESRRAVPSPQPLSRRERGLRLSVRDVASAIETRLPSPTGRRCPEGADEGTGAAAYDEDYCRLASRVASRRTLTPTPLPTGEGLERARRCFSHRDLSSLLPPGEGTPKGRMRVRMPLRTTKASAALHRETPRAAPSPKPLSRRERGVSVRDAASAIETASPFSHREKVPRRGG